MSHIILLAALTGAMAAAALALGPRSVMRYGWPFALLIFPSWIAFGIGSIPYNGRVAAGIFALLGLALHGGLKPWGRLLWTDALVALLFASMMVTAFVSGEMAYSTIPSYAGRWLLPYLVGRFFLGSDED